MKIAFEQLQVSEAKLLKHVFTQWKTGDWEGLALIEMKSIESHPEAARLALLVAAGLLQTGDMLNAKKVLRQAEEWGCGKQLICQILRAGVHNSIARGAAAIKDESRMMRHFEQSVLMAPWREHDLSGHYRAIHELARMGFLSDASALIDKHIQEADATMDHDNDTEAKLTVLKSEIGLLHHELSLAQQRKQLNSPETAEEMVSTLGNMYRAWFQALQQRSQSQLGQDLWVLEKTGYKQHGFFVEFGATDGVLLSNTYLLETEFEWKGICAEPNPTFFSDLKQNRNCIVSDACIGPSTGEIVEFVYADAFGGMLRDADNDMHKSRREAYQAVHGTVELETVSLHDFLLAHDAPKSIDYLSIDTEGSELSILEAFPFEKWDIRLLTIEHNFTEQREKIRALLASQGYACQEAQWDDWYYKKADKTFQKSEEE